MKKRLAALLAFALASSAQSARAEEPTKVASASAAEPVASEPSAEMLPDVKAAIPTLAYAYTAHGTYAKTVGAQASGLALGAAGQRAIVGGGVTVWGSPIDRLTIIADAQRNAFGNFAPSLAVVGRILGKADDGWSLGALGKFKIDGFASGPTKDEVESEIEAGALVTYGRNGWHFDANAIGGVGTGDEGEVDVEGRLRFGHDLGSMFRIGLDSQARVRMAGPKYLPNGRVWDFVAGPQLMLGSRHFFSALTAGPSTVGLTSDNIGWHGLLALGGSTL